MRLGRTPFLWLAVMVSACSGGAGTPSVTGSGGQGGPQNSHGGMPAGSDLACAGETVSNRAQVRRLTRTEYLNSLSDLLPGTLTPTYRAPLLDDPAVDGFENQTRVLGPNDLLVEGWSDIAADVARIALMAGRAPVLGCSLEGAEELPCVTSFVSNFGLKAFRRPMTAAEQASYMTLYQTLRQELDAAGAMELLVQAFLQSPQFLYRSEIGQPVTALARRLDGFEIATRLSYLVVQSTPDDALLAAAADGALNSPDGLAQSVLRLLGTPAAATAFGEFVRQWLELNEVFDRGAHKDPGLYPGWNRESATAALDDTRAFAGFVFGQADPTFATLLQSAVGPGPGAEPQPRAGVLSRLAFLAANARSVAGSPPLRGAAVQRSLLCSEPPAPPADVDRSEPTSATSTGVTNRERFEARIAPAACKGCHVAMDGIGNGFENYDAIGQFRTHDNGQPVNATGILMDSGATTDGAFNGAAELAARLATSSVAIECFVTRFFQYTYGRAAVESDHCAVERLRRAFVASGGNIVGLITQIVLAPEFALVSPVMAVAP